MAPRRGAKKTQVKNLGDENQPPNETAELLMDVDELERKHPNLFSSNRYPQSIFDEVNNCAREINGIIKDSYKQILDIILESDFCSKELKDELTNIPITSKPKVPEPFSIMIHSGKKLQNQNKSDTMTVVEKCQNDKSVASEESIMTTKLNQESFVSKQCSINVSSENRVTRSQTRKQENFDYRLTSMVVNKNSSRINTPRSSSNVPARDKTSVKVQTPTNRKVQPSQPSSEPNTNQKMNTPSNSRIRKPPQEILKNSVQKLGQAEEKRKAFIQNKQQQIRDRSEERKRRVLANLEQQKQAKPTKMETTNITPALSKIRRKIAKENNGKPDSPMMNAETQKRHDERVKKIENFKLEQLNKNKAQLTKKGEIQKDTQKPNPKPNPVVNQPMKLETGISEDDDSITPPNTLQPINCPLSPILGQPPINMSFVVSSTPQVVTNEKNPPTNLNGTIVVKKNKEQDFVTPTKPAPKASSSQVHNHNQAINAAYEVNSYALTPPTPSISNYDISALVDSDDEAQIQHECLQQHKKIPKWARGRQLYDAIKKQFGERSYEERQQAYRRVFGRPKLPVDLEEMELDVDEKHRIRTSSALWDNITIDSNM